MTGVTGMAWMTEKEEEEKEKEKKFLRPDGPTGQSKVVQEVLADLKNKTKKTQKKIIGSKFWTTWTQVLAASPWWRKHLKMIRSDHVKWVYSEDAPWMQHWIAS